MSTQTINATGQTWNYLGRFYGVNPQWLAAYNRRLDVDTSTPVRGQVRIPSARDLVQLRPAYEAHYKTAAQGADRAGWRGWRRRR